MRRPPDHLTHGPRRLVWRPWRRVCRCGFGRWPCYPWLMLRRQARDRETSRAAGRAAVFPARPRHPAINAAAPLLTRGQAVRSGPVAGGRVGRW